MLIPLVRIKVKIIFIGLTPRSKGKHRKKGKKMANKVIKDFLKAKIGLHNKSNFPLLFFKRERK